MSAPGRLRGLIFDMDGTLADTEEVHRRAFNRAFEDLNLPVRWDPVGHRRRLVQGSGRERLAVLFAEPPLSEMFRGEEAARMVLRVHERKTDFFTEEINAGRAELRPARRLLMEAAEAGIPTAVASTAHTRSVHTVLRSKLGEDLYRRFTAVYGSHDVVHKKPHPEVYLRCINDLGIPPASLIAFEDTRLGLQSALAAGLPTVVTYTHWTDDQDFSGAVLVTDCLGDPQGPACQIRSAPPGFGQPPHLTLAHLEALLRD